ncbi:MAG: radical SAM protein [Elusimicrobia bacterium]|nr:radical SAM protein [Elusimicrobiota bacterium]
MKLSRFYFNYRYGVHWEKPRLILRLLGAYAKLLLLRRVPMRYADINMGLACNLSCEHCFSENFKVEEGQELSDEEWSSVFRQLREMGTVALGFTGGEPLAYRRLFDLIRLAQPERMLIIVCTNGTLLTPEIARRLKKAGVDVLQISLDSGLAEEHDAFRRKTGAFTKTLGAFAAAREAGLMATVVPTVSHQNVRSPGLRALIVWARDNGVLVNLSMAAPVGEWAGNSDCLLTPGDLDELDRLTREHPHVRRDFETNYWTQGCGAAIEKLYITPFGDVLPCPYMHITFGNVRRESIDGIRRRMLANRFLKGYHPRCLTAENDEFIKNYLPKQYLKGQSLPTAEQVFGRSERDYDGFEAKP